MVRTDGPGNRFTRKVLAKPTPADEDTRLALERFLVVHGGDVGVVQTGGGPGLPLEARGGGTAPVGQGLEIRGDGLARGELLHVHFPQ
ncbi:hypothetical protein ACFZAG_08240 [Streptomyces sp. NPDC012403]|uniref:hypothetical protein n=1 Tax=Streptomyces sp. NPDC012403 TaxID=3364831 RepID=UPI0036F0877E